MEVYHPRDKTSSLRCYNSWHMDSCSFGPRELPSRRLVTTALCWKMPRHAHSLLVPAPAGSAGRSQIIAIPSFWHHFSPPCRLCQLESAWNSLTLAVMNLEEYQSIWHLATRPIQLVEIQVDSEQEAGGLMVGRGDDFFRGVDSSSPPGVTALGKQVARPKTCRRV